MVRDLVRLDQPLEQRLGAVVTHEGPLRLVPRQVQPTSWSTKSSTPPVWVGPATTEFTVMTGARRRLREAARHRQQRGLRDAVVHHLDRDHDRRVARDHSTRPKPRSVIPGSDTRISRTPASTLTSK